MDRGIRARLEQELGTGISAVRSLGGQHGVAHFRLQLSTGPAAFAKVGRGFAAEASGLGWLADAGAAVPAVLAVAEDFLVIDWIETSAPEPRAAPCFGRELAALHAAGAEAFGAPWPGEIAGLPLLNEAPPNWPAPPGGGWAEWYAAARVLPYVRLARDRGALIAAEAGLAEAAAGHAAQVAGPAEPPARIHGDCWSGNVLWSGGRGWLIDPAAHGGHRETDLAMLALFGAPRLDRIIAAYTEAAPLASGWRDRVPLHQLHPLLVHVCLFGAGYAGPVRHAARAALTGGG